MTKSTITRERLEELAAGQSGFNLRIATHEESQELARMALAAMDSEYECLPLDYLQGHKDGLEWAAQLAEANHPETGDWLYDDPIELAKAIRKGPDMPPAQPAADSEPVAWDYEWASCITCEGPQDFKRVIEREAPPEWAVAEGQARNIIPLYRHAQPAPVVPEDIPDSVYEILCQACGGKAWMYEDALWNACRAAMLQAEPVCTCPSGDGSLRWPCPVHPGNTPVIPDTWIPVSERLPEEGGRYWCYVEEQNSLGKSYYQWNCSWNGEIWGGAMMYGRVTHWMPLPAAPQEVRKSNVIGTYQGADGKDHPIINLSGPLQEVK